MRPTSNPYVLANQLLLAFPSHRIPKHQCEAVVLIHVRLSMRPLTVTVITHSYLRPHDRLTFQPDRSERELLPSPKWSKTNPIIPFPPHTLMQAAIWQKQKKQSYKNDDITRLLNQPMIEQQHNTALTHLTPTSNPTLHPVQDDKPSCEDDETRVFSEGLVTFPGEEVQFRIAANCSRFSATFAGDYSLCLGLERLVMELLLVALPDGAVMRTNATASVGEGTFRYRFFFCFPNLTASSHLWNSLPVA